eukprot:scaffold18887_cov226-Skeletonema_marinoi.AAC.1
MPANGLSPDLGTAQIREIWSLQLAPELRLAARGLSALHIICNALIVADEFFLRPASFRCWAKSGMGMDVGMSIGRFDARGKKQANTQDASLAEKQHLARPRFGDNGDVGELGSVSSRTRCVTKDSADRAGAAPTMHNVHTSLQPDRSEPRSRSRRA